jgi:hypothetical protein
MSSPLCKYSAILASQEHWHSGFIESLKWQFAACLSSDWMVNEGIVFGVIGGCVVNGLRGIIFFLIDYIMVILG